MTCASKDAGKVCGVTNQPPVQYFYDGEGRRVQKITSFGTSTYVYDAGGQLAAEYYAPAVGVTQPAGETGLRFLHADHLGSTRVDTNGSGANIAFDSLIWPTSDTLIWPTLCCRFVATEATPAVVYTLSM